MPVGTLFMEYDQLVFGTLCAKGETLKHDFRYEDITKEIDCIDSWDRMEQLKDAQSKGASLYLDFDCLSRDGSFNNDQLFAVYEAKDVEMLIDKLKRCVNIAYKLTFDEGKAHL